MKCTRFFLRSIAEVVFAALLMFGGQAAATDLADVPMAVKNTVHPNIMFTLDDSGSMQFEVIPESDDVFFTFPRANPLYGASWGYGGSFDTVARFNSDNRYARYFRTARFNPLYYDPAIRYLPWSNADGSLMGNSSPTAACHNPNLCSGATSEGTIDLTVDTTWDVAWRNDNGSETTASRTFYPATYFNYVGTAPHPTSAADANNTEAKFNRIEIKSANAPFTKAVGRTDCVGATCTYTEEIQNFANWYSYYRSRILTARAGVGRAFARQGSGMRVGFGAINKGSTSIDSVDTGTIISGVRKFTGSDRTSFFSALYGHVMPSEGTPLRSALDNVGQYFMRADDLGPYGETPGSSGGTQFECRQNYHILMTDGYWNGNEASTAAARNNNDGTDGPTISTPTSFSYSAVPPYSDTYSNTLADVAMHYWKNDLRSDLSNRVPTNAKDVAYWQHMVNFTVGLGVTGSISASTISSAITDPTSFTGATPTNTVAWTDPSSVEAHKIDDLAHAAVNSRGGFFSASDPTAFADALATALQDIDSRNGAAAAVAVANANLVSGDSVSYASGYNSGNWTGELSAYALDPATGEASTTATWTAQSQLDARTPSDRKIASYTGTAGSGQGIQFQPTSAVTSTKLSAAQQTLLNTPSTTDGASVLAWLRGDRSLEGSSYRVRTHLLGDIINSEPVIVREPRANYTDAGYLTFKTTYASRTKVVYQGANDGMLHAFATTGADAGKELWAYIPNLVIPNLNYLTRKTGFTHRFYVDGTPAVGDVDFERTVGETGGGEDWRTVLVGGLNKGGRGYYALDVTSPDAAAEANVAAKVLWEFPNSATSSTHKNNVGYSFGKPIIVKTAAEEWVVLVTSGYNNGTETGGDGKGYLYVLNARTGEVIRALTTDVGTAADPSGLAQIAAYVENGDVDNTVNFVYGGDLKGNVWRFDLSGMNSTSWNVKKIATLVDASGNFQPITTTPDLAKISYGGGFKRLIYVGTGKYLGDTDVPGTLGADAHATQTQTMYVLVDDLTSAPTIDPLRNNLVQQSVTVAGVFTTAAVDYSTKKGWFIDLPRSGERANTDPAVALTTLVFNTNIPSSDPCSPGGSSYQYSMDYAYEQGRSTPYVTAVSAYLGDALASRAVLVKTTTGELKALTRKSDATTTTSTVPTPPGSSGTKRVSWRELPER